MILSKKVDLGYFDTLKGIDLKKIAGIVLPEGGTSGRVELLMFKEVVSVREKSSAIFPPVQAAGLTTIQSVAIMADGNVLFSITGHITSQMRLLVDKIAEIVKRDGLNGAYFPAYGVGTEAKGFYVGGKNGVSDAIALPAGMKNIQPLMKKGKSAFFKGVIFTDDITGHNIVKEISLDNLYCKSWADAKIIKEIPEILYLDRVENEVTIITTRRGIFTLNLRNGNLNKALTSAKEMPSAVLRLGAGALAFFNKEGINTLPPRSLEAIAIAQAC